MLRVAGSLITNQVRAYDLLRMFGREGRPTPLGQAFAEYGRIAKTLHLLAVIDPVDDTYRRRVNRQLTIQEARHTLARDVCHGRRGRIHQAYREGQEDQLGSLGLVLNAVVLWNSRYLDAAMTHLRAHPPKDREVSRACRATRSATAAGKLGLFPDGCGDLACSGAFEYFPLVMAGRPLPVRGALGPSWARHLDVLGAQRHKRARIRSERRHRWGRPAPAA
jgi:hypothetical protein